MNVIGVMVCSGIGALFLILAGRCWDDGTKYLLCLMIGSIIWSCGNLLVSVGKEEIMTEKIHKRAVKIGMAEYSKTTGEIILDDKLRYLLSGNTNE